MSDLNQAVNAELAKFAEWESERAELSENEGAEGVYVDADDWHASDDTAVDGYRRVVELLRELSGLDIESSASRQHFIDTGEYLPQGEVEPYCNHDADAVIYGVCECGEVVDPTAYLRAKGVL